MRRWLLVGGATAGLLLVLGLGAVVHDRPPATPGAWLARSGLEARFVTVEGHRLRYVRAGSGPAVVLVHGFASSLYTWKDTIPALAPAHDVVALDLPGFGESDLPADLSFEELPAAVLGLMDRLGIERAALVGHSMGGAVVAYVAAEQPARVDALVLLDAAGLHLQRGEPATVRLVRSAPASLLAWLPGKRFLVERSLREVFHDERHVTDERLAEYLAAARRRGSVAAVRSLLASLDGRGAIVEQRLPRIQAPTLVVWGREDRWIPVSDAARFGRAIPGARTVVLDGCGHMPQVEKPEVVGPLLREFLSGGLPGLDPRPNGTTSPSRAGRASRGPSGPSGSGGDRGR